MSTVLNVSTTVTESPSFAGFRLDHTFTLFTSFIDIDRAMQRVFQERNSQLEALNWRNVGPRGRNWRKLDPPEGWSVEQHEINDLIQLSEKVLDRITEEHRRLLALLKQQQPLPVKPPTPSK